MAEPVFPIAILEPKLHPARLEIFAVRATGYFQISVLSRRPDLNVVALGRGKTQIAGAQFDDSIMQAEQLQYAFCVSRKRFQFVIRFFRRRDFDQLHLVELMHADECRGFRGPPRRLRAGNMAYRQQIFWEDRLRSQSHHDEDSSVELPPVGARKSWFSSKPYMSASNFGSCDVPTMQSRRTRNGGLISV